MSHEYFIPEKIENGDFRLSADRSSMVLANCSKLLVYSVSGTVISISAHLSAKQTNTLSAAAVDSKGESGPLGSKSQC